MHRKCRHSRVLLAGIQWRCLVNERHWTPAYAGVTKSVSVRLLHIENWRNNKLFVFLLNVDSAGTFTRTTWSLI